MDTITSKNNERQEEPWALTIEQVADRLQVHRATITALINDGRLRALRLGKIWRVPLGAIEEYLAERDNPVPELRSLSVDEVADRLQVHRDTVLGLIQAGELPARKVGRNWRVAVGALRAFLDT